jgi:hypothetical protein
MKRQVLESMKIVGKAWVLILVCTGCASIILGGSQTVSISSQPSDAKVVIMDLKGGNELAANKTPYTATLQRGRGYFKSAKYKVVIEKEGYASKEVILEGGTNAWFIAGNLVLGGLIGWFIVDPATGAMWTLQPKDINENLAKAVSLFRQDKGLMIVLKSDLPELPADVESKMKPVKIP